MFRRARNEAASESCQTAAAAHPVTIQRKMTIGAVNDPLEQEADAVADRVISMKGGIPEAGVAGAQGIQRKCSHCEEEEEAQMKPMTPFLQRKESSVKTVASEAVSNRIQSGKGRGNNMEAGTKSFMEQSFGRDFSGVKIHTDQDAIQLNRDLNAKAFTVGSDIYFNEGQYRPDIDSGRHLLAHELTHTIQQGKCDERINRKLSVTDPSKKIPNPTGKGKVQTNNDTALDYLKTICPAGGITISSAGEVTIPDFFCSKTSYPPDFVGPLPHTASKSGTPVGCGCICDLVTSGNSWRITIDDASWPHTRFDNDANALTPGSGGSGGIVTAPSPNSPKLWGAVTAPGGFADIAPWLVLGHELCGHAWLGNTGDAGRDEAKPRGRGGHQATVERENLIRDEHGITRRGTHRQPYCGESFFHPTGTAASAGKVTMSSYLAACEAWRIEYNKLNGTSFKIGDAIPVKPGEKLPP